MKKMSLFLASVIASSTIWAEPRVTYVGDGRYACSGSEKDCAPIRQRNEERERLREYERQHREQIDEYRRKTRALEDIRDEQRRRD